MKFNILIILCVLGPTIGKCSTFMDPNWVVHVFGWIIFLFVSIFTYYVYEGVTLRMWRYKVWNAVRCWGRDRKTTNRATGHDIKDAVRPPTPQSNPQDSDGDESNSLRRRYKKYLIRIFQKMFSIMF